MKTVAIQYALIAALAAAVGLSAAAVLAQTGLKATGRTLISQYCAPPPETLEAHRFYCQLAGG
jgi:hypothetical protein